MVPRARENMQPVPVECWIWKNDNHNANQLVETKYGKVVLCNLSWC